MYRLSSKQAGGIILATVLCLAGLPIVIEFHHARRVAEESAQLALYTEAVRLLEESHRLNGKYPDSLETLAFTFPDGGDRSTLALLHYQTDGSSYSLTTTGVASGEIYRKSL